MTDNVVHVLLPKFIRHEKEDDSGVSSCDLLDLASDAGTVHVHPDDLHVDLLPVHCRSTGAQCSPQVMHVNRQTR